MTIISGRLQGHELTLRVLYRLFGEAEEEHDFFSSTTAASAYEMFLLTVVCIYCPNLFSFLFFLCIIFFFLFFFLMQAETLRDSFPPTDKSLSRLLGEVPYLPKSVLKLLEGLCLLGSFDKGEKELQSGDRVTQGLSAVWSLILLRPPLREDCLKIALLVFFNYHEPCYEYKCCLLAHSLHVLLLFIIKLVK